MATNGHETTEETVEAITDAVDAVIMELTHGEPQRVAENAKQIGSAGFSLYCLALAHMPPAQREESLGSFVSDVRKALEAYEMIDGMFDTMRQTAEQARACIQESGAWPVRGVSKVLN